MSEWFGLSIALALSVAVNVQHTLATRDDDVPRALAALVAASIPIVLAYGIHVYGRAMSRGLSAHVMADDPDRLHFDVAHLGDASPAERARTTAPPAARVPARPATAARVDAPAPAARPATQAVEDARADAPQPARRKIPDELREAAYAEYAAARDAGVEWEGGQIGERLGIDAGHARNIRNKQWRPRWEAERTLRNEAAEPAAKDATQAA